MKYLNIFLALLFAVFAVVQLNDPDPLFWMLIYGIVAFISAFAAFGKYNLWLMLAVLAVLIFELFKLFPSISGWVQDGMPSIVSSMKAEEPHIEFVREFLGLAICFVVLLFHYFNYRKRSIQRAAEEGID